MTRVNGTVTLISVTLRRATRFIPVYHPGALLYFGDVYASQGDSERSVHQGATSTQWICIIKPDVIICGNVACPLNLAVETATIYLIRWLVDAYQFTPQDAYGLISICSDFRVNVYQMCKSQNCVSSPRLECQRNTSPVDRQASRKPDALSALRLFASSVIE
ncbi:MAG: hypothetical protein M2R45_00746 [Verrucomicrobia subdivision 3 bacterium]|nr:hypothetical protein [Limisphaerales bacterium]MCS1413147.1 hypothetical protein [Limisphaerales bacterium]